MSVEPGVSVFYQQSIKMALTSFSCLLVKCHSMVALKPSLHEIVGVNASRRLAPCGSTVCKATPCGVDRSCFIFGRQPASSNIGSVDSLIVLASSRPACTR
jgi:hypothetical protein